MGDGYILQMKNITKTFPGVKALSDVTLEVSEASIHAICGENGAGKSTLMKVLSGVYPYGSYDGEIIFQGKKMAFKNIKDSERAGIVIIHQELTMIPELSVTENIFISHKLNEIAAVSDYVTVIRDGETVDGYAVEAGKVDENKIIKAMVGREIENRYPEHTPKIGEVILEVSDWNVEDAKVSGKMLCKNSSFNVRTGEIVGFAGLMGAGRTELMRSLFGKNMGIFRGGTMRIKGREVRINSVREAIKNKVAYVPEDRKGLGLNLLDSIRKTVVSANLDVIKTKGLLDFDKERAASEKYRDSLKIKCRDVSVGVNTLSGGNQQKVVLSKWMFTEPDILILDEPTRGIDVGAKYEIYKLIHELADQGKAIILVSSELPELLGMADRIYTIFEGSITGEILAKEATQEILMKKMTITA